MSEITVPLPGELLLDRLELSSPSQVNRSTWTGRRKVIGLAGVERWQGVASIASIATEEQERQWRAFLFALKGPQNWFRWPLPCNEHLGSKPTVASGASNAYILPLTGMQPNTLILRAGQFMTVPLPSGHQRAVCLTSNLVANGSGAANAIFEPALNETPTFNTTVETLNPFVAMAPVEPVIGLATTQGVSGTSFDVEESL
ncbi:distal tail protein [Synechococcus phage Yong-M3-232]|nr:distal tail protein [Synechococcus phage Yong-M3-232]